MLSVGVDERSLRARTNAFSADVEIAVSSSDNHYNMETIDVVHRQDETRILNKTRTNHRRLSFACLLQVNKCHNVGISKPTCIYLLYLAKLRVLIDLK